MNDEIQMLDVVALLEDLPERNLWRGQVGTVVELLAPDVAPMLPANGPIPPTTATITASQSGITCRRTATMHSSDMAIQPTPCAQPSTVRGPAGPSDSQSASSAR